MRRTNIYLEERQTAALDLIAADEGVTRAEVIRRLIDQGLQGATARLDGDLAAIDASFGAFADDDLDDALARRSGDDREQHLAALWNATA